MAEISMDINHDWTEYVNEKDELLSYALKVDGLIELEMTPIGGKENTYEVAINGVDGQDYEWERTGTLEDIQSEAEKAAAELLEEAAARLRVNKDVRERVRNPRVYGALPPLKTE